MKDTQEHILHMLLRHKAGVTIEALAEEMQISRNAVRQHLMTLERDGMVTRGEQRPTSGRPHQLYVLTAKGSEHFPRQYSWFSELLLAALKNKVGDIGVSQELQSMGQVVGAGLAEKLAQNTLPQKIGIIAEEMTKLGYDAEVVSSSETDVPVIEAYNCVFHKLADQIPEVCQFDLALLSTASGCQAKQHSCMLRGGANCSFHFEVPAKPK